MLGADMEGLRDWHATLTGQPIVDVVPSATRSGGRQLYGFCRRDGLYRMSAVHPVLTALLGLNHSLGTGSRGRPVGAFRRSTPHTPPRRDLRTANWHSRQPALLAASQPTSAVALTPLMPFTPFTRSLLQRVLTPLSVLTLFTPSRVPWCSLAHSLTQPGMPSPA